MPSFGDVFGQIIPGAILQAIGSPEQQRALAEKARLEAEERRKFDILRELQREQMAETRRQHNLQYGPTPTEIDVPGIGKVSGPRWAIPALIQAAASEKRDISPEEAGVLSGYRERALAGPTGVVSRGGIPWSPGLEAEATKKAFPQLAGEVSPLTVDLPQVSVPRQSFERMMTEAGQQRKELATEERQNLQRMSTASYRQLYDQLISEKVPHSLANATAIDLATRKYGIAPEHQAFVPTPTEREPRAPKVGTFTDDAGNLNVYGVDETGNVLFKKPLGRARTTEPKFNLGQFRADLAKRASGLTVQDAEVQKMTPQQATKVLQDLGRSDFITNLLQGALGGGPPAATKTPAEVEADRFLQGLE